MKRSETSQNLSFGSNGVDWVHLLRKIQTQLLLLHESRCKTGQTDAITAQLAETPQNMSFGSNGVD
jgi:hypothetical protein